MKFVFPPAPDSTAEASIPNNLGAISPFRFLLFPPVVLFQFLSCLLLLQISPTIPLNMQLLGLR